MRFHKLQNVQIALDFLKHRQVGHIKWYHELWKLDQSMTMPCHMLPDCVCVFTFWYYCCFLLSGQAGQHQKWWHSRWEPQADPGVNMDHHPSLPGLLRCQCCVLLYYRSIALSLGSAPISCCFSSPWNQVDSTLQTSSQKKNTFPNQNRMILQLI